MCVPHTDKERVCLSLLLDILAIMTYYPHQFRLLIITSPLPRSNNPAQPDLADLLVWLITFYSGLGAEKRRYSEDVLYIHRWKNLRLKHILGLIGDLPLQKDGRNIGFRNWKSPTGYTCQITHPNSTTEQLKHCLPSGTNI